MRILISIVVGVVLGALAFEMPGVGLGLLVGLVVGLIWHGRARQQKQAGQTGGLAATAQPAQIGNAASVQPTIEARLAAIEARLARLEGGQALAPFAGAIVPETAGGLPLATGAMQPSAALSAAAAALHEEMRRQGVVAAEAMTGEPSIASIPVLASDAASADMTPDLGAAAPPAPPPAPPRAPAGPTLLQRLFSGNVVAKLGILILFFGVCFAIKFALENELVPIAAWFALAALGGIALLVVGWRLRANVTGYGLILQGGGVGILYLVTFGALKLFQMLPATLALLLLVAIVVLSALLAVLQNSLALAAIGVTGGFLAPILASTAAGATSRCSLITQSSTPASS